MQTKVRLEKYARRRIREKLAHNKSMGLNVLTGFTVRSDKGQYQIVEAVTEVECTSWCDTEDLAKQELLNV